jgi:hypothetical protein
MKLQYQKIYPKEANYLCWQLADCGQDDSFSEWREYEFNS